MSNEKSEVLEFGRERDRGGNPHVDRGGTLSGPHDKPGQGNGHGYGHEHSQGNHHGHHRPPPAGRSYGTL